MGAVYKARQRKLDRLVSLKIIAPNRVRDPAFAERFTREARTLADTLGERLTAMIDLSDGLGSDARHIAASSAVRLRLFTERIPVGATAKIL